MKFSPESKIVIRPIITSGIYSCTLLLIIIKE